MLNHKLNSRLAEAEDIIDNILDFVLSQRHTNNEMYTAGYLPTFYIPEVFRKAKEFLGETKTNQSKVPVKQKLRQVRDVTGRYSVTMQPVNSSFIDAVGFDAKRNNLYLEMNGLDYVYYDVPSYIWNRLMNADSHGTYYTKSIKGRYVCDAL